MKRVLLITPDFPPSKGGIQSLLWDIACNIKKLSITVITPHRYKDRDFDERAGIRIIRTHPNKIIFLIQSILFTLFLCPDIVICGHIISAPVGLLAKGLFNKPYIVYTYALEIMAERRKNIVSFFLKHAEKIITISAFTKNRLVYLGVKKVRIKIIHPSVDIYRFRPDIDTGLLRSRLNLNNKKVLLTVARMAKNERYKGQDSVIDVLLDVLKKCPDTIYLIIGGGDDKERLKKLARDKGVGERVIFLEDIKDEELPLFYCLCDIFVMPSKEIHTKDGVKAEGFGIGFLEAGACGKPVIGGRSGGIPDAVIDGKTGILVDSENPLELRDATIKLLKNSSLRREMGDNARRRIEEKFTLQRIIEQTERVFLSVISHNSLFA